VKCWETNFTAEEGNKRAKDDNLSLPSTLRGNVEGKKKIKGLGNFV
jgi:hypothetical protein